MVNAKSERIMLGVGKVGGIDPDHHLPIFLKKLYSFPVVTLFFSRCFWGKFYAREGNELE